MNKEELNNVVCECASDYEILNSAYDYIEKLEKENKQLKEKNKMLRSADKNNSKTITTLWKEKDKLVEENKELKDNRNKVKEYCKENLHFYSGIQNEDLETDASIQGVLDKMQELEGGGSD